MIEVFRRKVPPGGSAAAYTWLSDNSLSVKLAKVPAWKSALTLGGRNEDSSVDKVVLELVRLRVGLTVVDGIT